MRWKHKGLEVLQLQIQRGEGQERWRAAGDLGGSRRPGMEGKKAKLIQLWTQKRVGGTWTGAGSWFHASLSRLHQGLGFSEP